ncbi:sensor histidine kinase [Dactylosporangium vinaceum]|uniref:Signal transduction histidine-protein kinase/phosphatase MprB n=1 Tax=Dactylosporangium vinaceum TaxID=53362 RepID=A0ABV5MFE1_9ACTN
MRTCTLVVVSPSRACTFGIDNALRVCTFGVTGIARVCTSGVGPVCVCAFGGRTSCDCAFGVRLGSGCAFVGCALRVCTFGVRALRVRALRICAFGVCALRVRVVRVWAACVRRRLALLVTAAMALVLVAFLVPLALLLRAGAEDRAVATATVQAQSLGALVATADAESLRLTVEQANVDSAHPVSIYFADGTVVGAAVPMTPGVRLAAQRGISFGVAHADGREILIAVQGLPAGTAVVRSFVPERDLRRGVTRAWLVLAAVGAGLLLLGLAVADRLAVAVVRPIRTLAAVSESLSAGDLDRRAPAADGPGEVRAVAAALNRLAGRIRDLLRQEREAAADLSHRMRTPMTALRLDAEGISDPNESARMLEHVAALDRALTAVIEDARRERIAPECDAAAVVAERVAFWSVLAEDQGRVVRTVLTPGPLPVAVSAGDLAAAVDALLGNVFAHTDEGTGFAVELHARPGRTELVVDDEGPGFDAQAAARGVSGGGSTGLGLDIARRTAESTGGHLMITGARVTLELLTDP